MIAIIGVDPSLTSTGVSNGTTHFLLKTEPSPEDISPIFDTYDRVMAQMYPLRAFIQEQGVQNVHVYIEDVKKTMTMQAVEGQTASVGVSHLFEMGFWFSAYVEYIDRALPYVVTHVVNPAMLKSFVSGKGNMAKSRMMTIVYKRWGIDFGELGDSGLDKLHAFCLFKYGEAVQNGEYTHVESHRRGRGTRAVAKRRARSGTEETL